MLANVLRFVYLLFSAAGFKKPIRFAPRAWPQAVFGTAFLVTIALVVLMFSNSLDSTAAEEVPQIEISPRIPADLNASNGGASTATLEQAAAFAWQEFVALNWPAAAGKRDVAGPQSFDANNPDARVWETFRGRVELYPGTGKPFDESKRGDDYGYGASPKYIYDPDRLNSRAGTAPGEVPPCDGSAPSASAPWNNLDEPDQQNVRSGLSPKEPFPGQQILVESKVNRQEYIYVVARGWYGAKSLRLAKKKTGEYVRTKLDAPPAPEKIDDPSDTQYISFPYGTMEIKAAWRRLGPHDNPSEYYVNRVRYYKLENDKACYVDSNNREGGGDRWGLVAMHIMQKTPSAPYFVWATFDHVKTLVLDKLDKNGRPISVETPEGALSEAGKAIATPWTPNIQVMPAGADSEQIFVKESMTPPANPTNQLFYYQEPLADLPEIKYVAVNRRFNNIPEPIVKINRAAQAAIRKASPNSPFQHYRLVSVQWLPLDKKPGTYYEGPMPPGIYYAANVNIEAPPVNQRFSGQFVEGFTKSSDYLNRDMPLFNPKPNPGDPVFFTNFYKGKGYLSGGCMGCHGFRQVYGTDWSFLLDRQRVLEPEVHVDGRAPRSHGD